MKDIQCPRCGALIGRVEGKAQFRCNRARCFAIVDVDTGSGKMVVRRYGGGENVRLVHDVYDVDEVMKRYQSGYFRAVRN